MQELNLIPHLTWELFFPDSVDYNTMPIEGTYTVMDEVFRKVKNPPFFSLFWFW